MFKTNICFSSVQDVSSFVKLANNYDFNINIISEKYVINGKSLMGIFSLPLEKALCLRAECDSSCSFVSEVSPFVVGA